MALQKSLAGCQRRRLEGRQATQLVQCALQHGLKAAAGAVIEALLLSKATFQDPVASNRCACLCILEFSHIPVQTFNFLTPRTACICRFHRNVVQANKSGQGRQSIGCERSSPSDAEAADQLRSDSQQQAAAQHQGTGDVASGRRSLTLPGAGLSAAHSATVPAMGQRLVGHGGANTLANSVSGAGDVTLTPTEVSQQITVIFPLGVYCPSSAGQAG